MFLALVTPCNGALLSQKHFFCPKISRKQFWTGITNCGKDFKLKGRETRKKESDVDCSRQDLDRCNLESVCGYYHFHFQLYFHFLKLRAKAKKQGKGIRSRCQLL